MKVIVDWPKDLTREEILRIADWVACAGHHRFSEQLGCLAAIAPTDVAPQEPVKRWVWTDEYGFSNSVEKDSSHPPYAILVTYPTAPKPKVREVTLWERQGTDGSPKERRWTPDGERYINPPWSRVGAGLVEE